METVHGELEIKKNITKTCCPRDPNLYHAFEQLVLKIFPDFAEIQN